MIAADTPCLWEIRRHLGHPATSAIIVLALTHAARLAGLNPDKNLTAPQFGEIIADILRYYGYLKVEELKYILKKGMRSERLFGRFDYNTVMLWIDEYDKERTEIAMYLSDREASAPVSRQIGQGRDMSFDEFVESLRSRAATDKKAAELLQTIQVSTSQAPAAKRKTDDTAFRQWRKNQYLTGKWKQK